MGRIVCKAFGVKQILCPCDVVGYRVTVEGNAASDQWVVGLRTHKDVVHAEAEVVLTVEMTDSDVNLLTDVAVQINGIFVPAALLGRHRPFL